MAPCRGRGLIRLPIPQDCEWVPLGGRLGSTYHRAVSGRVTEDKSVHWDISTEATG